MRLTRYLYVFVACLATFCWSAAAAQSFPTQSIKMVVPYPPGGPTDVQARIVAQRLGELLGHPVIVVNRAGAGGMLGSNLVAKAKADGYTLLMGASGPQVLGPLMAKEPPYNPAQDFTPISLVSYSPLILVVNSASKPTSVKELIALAKDKPGALNYGSFGNGTMAHLAGELFKAMAGVDIVHIPFQGSAPAVTALLAGQIDVMFDTVITSLPHVKSGRLRGLAVTKATRSSSVPELPTVAETMDGFEAVSWIGVMGPAGLPKEIVQRLSAEMVKVLADSSVRERLLAAGAEPVGSDAATFGIQMKSELSRWEPVVKAAGLLRSQ